MNIALILAGGTGTRLGKSTPKQYIEINGRPVIAYCLDVFAQHDDIDAVQIVASKEWHSYICANVPFGIKEKIKGFSNPGINRQLSIWNALNDIEKYANADDVLIVHDAARPCISEELLTEGIHAIKNHDGVMPVLPMKDTVYYSKDGRIVDSLVERSCIFAGQAPEFFYFGKYLKANRKLMPDQILQINGSTEPAILQKLDIVMIPGDEKNFKITTKEDLERFQALVEE